MKPFKAGQMIAHWLLRLVAIYFIVTLYFNQLTPVNLSSPNFYIALAAIVLSVLLLLGGLMSKPNLTVISGLGITILFAYLFAVDLQGLFGHTNVLYLMTAIIGFFFFTRGNS